MWLNERMRQTVLCSFRTCPGHGPLVLCRVRGALAVHQSFDAGMHSMKGFFAALQVW
jgi:hypothetical protein